VKATTHEDYGNLICVRINPYLGRFGLDDLERDAETIEQWIAQLQKEDYAFLSSCGAFRLLRRALKIAVARPTMLTTTTIRTAMR
jgi:hypothetical protein